MDHIWWEILCRDLYDKIPNDMTYLLPTSSINRLKCIIYREIAKRYMPSTSRFNGPCVLKTSSKSNNLTKPILTTFKVEASIVKENVSKVNIVESKVAKVKPIKTTQHN